MKLSLKRFFLMETMNQTILGLPFFEQHDILIHPKTRTLNLPNMTNQLTQRVHKDGKVSSLTTKKIFSYTLLKIFPSNQTLPKLFTYLHSSESIPEGTVAIVEPNPPFENRLVSV